MRACYDCSTLMVAIAESSELAEWARQPIEWGVGSVSMRPASVCLGEIDPGDDLGLGLLTALSAQRQKT